MSRQAPGVIAYPIKHPDGDSGFKTNKDAKQAKIDAKTKSAKDDGLAGVSS